MPRTPKTMTTQPNTRDTGKHLLDSKHDEMVIDAIDDNKSVALATSFFVKSVYIQNLDQWHTCQNHTGEYHANRTTVQLGQGHRVMRVGHAHDKSDRPSNASDKPKTRQI